MESVVHGDGASFAIRETPKGWQIVFQTWTNRRGVQGGYYPTAEAARDMAYTYASP